MKWPSMLRPGGMSDASNESRWLIVGLGNPGQQYSANRHNVGFLVVDELAGRYGLSFRRNTKITGFVAEGLVSSGNRVVLVKSHSFMNRSGGTVAGASRYYGVSPERIIVIHDELDLPFGTVRVKKGGGHGGHNGLRDIIGVLGTQEFVRVRVGIGRPPGRQSAADFVLRDFSADQRAEVPFLVSDAASASEYIVDDGITAAQQRIHAPK